MTLRDTIATDAAVVFCNESDFAEQVYYRPVGGGVRRDISAVVFRELVETYSDDEVTALDVYQVHVANDVDLGISSAEINTGGDKIELAPRDGKDAVVKTILKIVGQDNGMLVLEVR